MAELHDVVKKKTARKEGNGFEAGKQPYPRKLEKTELLLSNML